MQLIILFILTLAPLPIVADPTWLTVTLTNFTVKEKCIQYWEKHQNCKSPTLLITAKIDDKLRYTKHFLQIDQYRNKNKTMYSTTEWKESLSIIYISAEIIGENDMNPYGHQASCDSGESYIVDFNNSNETVQNKFFEVDSLCFVVGVLMRVEKECPNCPIPVEKQLDEENPPNIFSKLDDLLRNCDPNHLAIFLAFLCILALLLFLATLHFYLEQRTKTTYDRKPATYRSIFIKA